MIFRLVNGGDSDSDMYGYLVAAVARSVFVTPPDKGDSDGEDDEVTVAVLAVDRRRSPRTSSRPVARATSAYPQLSASSSG